LAGRGSHVAGKPGFGVASSHAKSSSVSKSQSSSTPLQLLSVPVGTLSHDSTGGLTV
jgi:hypothetical protein